MNKSSIARYAAASVLALGGIAVGASINEAHAAPPIVKFIKPTCVSGFSGHSKNNLGYACSSKTPICGSGHTPTNFVVSGGKFRYNCMKNSQIPK